MDDILWDPACLKDIQYLDFLSLNPLRPHSFKLQDVV